MGAGEEGAHERLKAHLLKLIEQKIAKHNGHIVKTPGDGLLVDLPASSTRCAVRSRVQQAMPQRNTGVAADNRI
jgi:adenylate cyclase